MMSSSSSSSLVDEDTRRIILLKTWCHGQLVLPAFSALYLWLVLFRGYNGFIFIYAAIVLPLWSYFSYTYVTNDTTTTVGRYRSSNNAATMKFSFRQLLGGFALVQAAHLGVLLVVVKDLSTSLNMLLMVASALFLVETSAFVLVVTFMGGRTSTAAVAGYEDLGEGYNLA